MMLSPHDWFGMIGFLVVIKRELTGRVYDVNVSSLNFRFLSRVY